MTKSQIVTSYVVRVGPYAWGRRVTKQEHEDACERMDQAIAARKPGSIAVFLEASAATDSSGVFVMDDIGASRCATDAELDAVSGILYLAKSDALDSWPKGGA